MKKLFFIFVCIAMSVLAMGQNNQLVWANGRLLYGTPIESIDSLTYDEMEDVDTLHLLLPRTLIKVVHDTVVKTGVVHDTLIQTQVVHDTIIEIQTQIVHDTVVKTEVVHDTIIEVQTQIVHDTVVKTEVVHDTLIQTQVVHDTIIEIQTQIVHDTVYVETDCGGEGDTPSAGIGVFSVGEGKTVTFSKGNLQYTQSTNTWSFAENQYDYLGEANSAIDADVLADKVDLFGWSTGATNFGVSTSTYNTVYSGYFVDWGTNQIGADAPNTWRTLTYDEWHYLSWRRPNFESLSGVAQVNGVNGLILLPDTWVCPKGITFKSGFYSEYSVEAYGLHQTFSAADWSILEAAGAVFLPAAGARYGSNAYGVQGYGDYWSATEDNSGNAGFLEFRQDAAYVANDLRNIGRSVRLVKDL